METKTDNEIQITPEDFKLIKSFYSEFTRKPTIHTNAYLIGWSELMPVVEKIETGLDRRMDVEISNNLYSSGVEYSVNIYDAGSSIHFVLSPRKSKIEAVCKAVVEFIKWYNSQQK
jgi:hypothetical protein